MNRPDSDREFVPFTANLDDAEMIEFREKLADTLAALLAKQFFMPKDVMRKIIDK